MKTVILWISLGGLPAFGAGTAYDEARHILTTLRETHYTHTTQIDETVGLYDVDCSAFANFVLAKSRPSALAELEASLTDHRRPLASDYVHLFESHPHRWRRVAAAFDLAAGDLIAWLIPPGSTSKDTGHVLFVAGAPEPNEDEPAEWLVPVVDSAVSGHGAADPRRKQGPNGVGAGTIGLVVDSKGHPIGFRWSGGTGVVKRTTIRLARPR